MQSEQPTAQVGMLVLATSIVQLANGFFGTFISLRVTVEGFNPTVTGIILSSYFAGFTIGALRCERIIGRVGHIRAYASFAGMVVAATMAMPLLQLPVPWICFAGDYWFWLRWPIHHHRELAQLKGNSGATWADLFLIHVGNVPRARLGTNSHRPD